MRGRISLILQKILEDSEKAAELRKILLSNKEGKIIVDGIEYRITSKAREEIERLYTEIRAI